MITFEHVGLRYGPGPEVLSDICFALEPGAFRFLTGTSGAGKTTLMGLIAMTLRATRGRVTVLGTEVNRAPPDALSLARRKVGVVFQDFRLLPHLTAFDNVALPLRIAGRPEHAIRKDVWEMLQWVGLADYARMLPPTLSGGQAQRVAIARAVIARPRLVLADEPTGSLDAVQGARVMGLFEALGRAGTTVLIATHSRGLLKRYPHPRLSLVAGRLTQTLAPAGTGGVEKGS
ncbi:MAG TPA: cell division ATP-binding protein FtsE [Rhodospirillaceae bacterium]|jgi:cell division transport system ATP-binding protein|nr:ATP-binding cassette domain-containing protein [Alphaproteobacteria bacterium]HBH25964.1 cell division ATP-binding protein FtsE [Rhodospirillaceae bacterium]